MDYKDMIEILPGYIQAIMGIIKTYDFQSGGPEEPSEEGEESLGEMTLWEKACWVRSDQLDQEALGFEEAGIPEDDPHFQAILAEAELVDMMLETSIRGRLENGGPRLIAFCQGWQIAGAEGEVVEDEEERGSTRIILVRGDDDIEEGLGEKSPGKTRVCN